MTDEQLPCTVGSATSDLLRLLTLHEVKLCITDRRLAENSALFGNCGMCCGSGQLPFELPEHRIRGEFLDHLPSYKDRTKVSVEHIKGWWIKRNCQPIPTQRAQFNQRDVVTEIKKADNAFWCCVSVYTFDNTLAVCGVILLKQENNEGFRAQKWHFMKTALP